MRGSGVDRREGAGEGRGQLEREVEVLAEKMGL